LKDNIKNGEPVTRAIYNSGYKSQNWLYESMGKKAPTFREERMSAELDIETWDNSF
jgi:methylphosphotriester-DNA--protein-cysteine methyltransferase